MWEDVTVALSLLGFLGAITLVLAELPAVIAEVQQAVKRHR